jgi:hypothetical protein
VVEKEKNKWIIASVGFLGVQNKKNERCAPSHFSAKRGNKKEGGTEES